MSLRSIHYDEPRWNDPDVFRPERFLTEDGKLIPDEGMCTFGLGKCQIYTYNETPISKF